MGWFSSSKKYYGAGVAIPMYDDTEYDFFKDAVYNAVRNDTDIVESILWAAEQVQPAPDTDEFYAYGKNTYGLPGMYLTDEPPTKYTVDSDDIKNNGKSIGGYFAPYPMVNLRINNIAVTSSNNPTAYTNGTEALTYLNLSMDNLLESLESNEDLSELNDASVGLNIPLTTESEEGKQYLYTFFDKLKAHSTYDINDWISITTSEDIRKYNNDEGWTTETVITTTNEIKKVQYLTYIAGEFVVTLGYSYIDSNVIAQTGTIGDVTTEIIIRPDYVHKVSKQVRERQDWTTKVTSYPASDSDFVITKQITSTTAIQIIVKGLEHRTYVHNKATVEPVTLQELRDDPDLAENFFIPLDHQIMLDIFPDDEVRNNFAEIAVTMNINALTIVTLKWYQTGLFKALITIVGFVLSIWTGGASGALAFILLTIVTEIIVGKYGEIGGSIFGAVVAIYTLGTSLISSGVRLAQLTAAELIKYTLSVASTVIDIVSRGIDLFVYYEMDGLAQESEEMRSEEEKLQEEIDSLSALLAEPTLPFNYVGVPYFNPNETPDDFYDRTIHVNNKGPLVFEVADNFVALSTMLPEFTGELTMSDDLTLNV